MDEITEASSHRFCKDLVSVIEEPGNAVDQLSNLGIHTIRISK